MLQDTISKMDEEQARYHMKRCVDSGLWIPDGGKNKDEDASGDSKGEAGASSS